MNDISLAELLVLIECRFWIWYSDNISWLRWVGFFALFILVAFCMVAVGVLTPDTNY